MNKEEIIEMVMQIGGCDRPEDDSPALKMFVAFAKLVAAKEREACAKLCDYVYDNIVTDEHIKHMALKIRARGQVALCITGNVGQKTTGENNLS